MTGAIASAPSDRVARRPLALNLDEGDDTERPVSPISPSTIKQTSRAVRRRDPTRRQQVARGFEAVSTIAIDAPRAKVWDALTNPAKVKQYMHGTNLTTDWKVGSPIAWKGEWKGKSYVDKGTVLEIEPEKLLKYTHWSPMGDSADEPENYHGVTWGLVEQEGKTILTLTQDNNATQAEADTMSKDNWGPMLEGLKKTAEM